jgi:hypothetical protein
VRLEAVHRDTFLTAADVDNEDLGSAAVDGVGTVIERRERLYSAATAHIDKCS